MTPEKYRQRLLSSGICTLEGLIGCTETDLEHMESTLNSKLPESYKDVLRVIGRASYGFLDNILERYPSLLTYTEYCRKYLAEFQVELPADALVISNHDGNEILFLRLSEQGSENVYKWDCRKSDELKLLSNSIWKIFVEVLDLEEEVRS